ncbi:MAG TPA: hypothetical protein VLV29_07345 [Steroidobacteraceae bacterium]|nr:hypothetical protein [Steroidobacteraceae bacterium]
MRPSHLNALGKELMASLWKRRPRGEEVSVQRATATLGDTAALDQLLRPLPEAEELRPRLAGQFFARAWDATAKRDYWVSSDGAEVVCFTIEGLTLKQAAAVRVRWDGQRARPELTTELLADLIAREIGRSVTLKG